MGLKTQESFIVKSDPYFFLNGIIENVEDISGTNPYNPEYQPFEVGVTVSILMQSTNSEWTEQVHYGGELGWNVDGTLKDWGRTGWTVSRLFLDFGIRFGHDNIPELENNGRLGVLPKIALTYLQGRKALLLKYVTQPNPNKIDRYWYNTWNKIVPLTDASEKELEIKQKEMEAAFLESVKKGFPRNYCPDCITEPIVDESESTPEGSGLVRNEETGEVTDEDLPF